MQTHFAWVPARCGLRPAGEGALVYIHMERSGVCIAIHRKFQTRRAAEDSTRLYGEAAQHRMRLSVDGYKWLELLYGQRVCRE